ncbi:MAG TPA: tripartite tricarboxylate transporter substrate binding protein [Burkholderiales bacterium]|nr:tripartite tricarboxylate transporter substrate binding protein [Burkholderiales bacterium]
MRCGIRALAALFVFVFAFPATAQQWPSRPVRVVVPFALGGATDLVARILGPALAESLGQPFVIENRPGASGNIGVEIAAKAPADGYTLLVGNISTNAVNASGFAGRLKFDPVKDLAPVTLVASVPTVLVTSPHLPPNTVKELIEYARARPGELNYSNPLGSYSHLDTLDLAARQGIKVVLIPSKGAGSAITSIINGEVHFSFLTMSSVIPHIKAGRMKALATTSRERAPELPDVPTMAEAGFPGVGSENWNGLFFQAQTPRAVVDRLFAATIAAMGRKPVHDAFMNASLPVTLSKSPEDFRAFVDAEVRRWARIVKEHDIHLE